MDVRVSQLYNISLATALIFGTNPIQADIVNDIRQANQTLRSNPNDWRAASGMFINAFNEFSQAINDVLEERGGNTRLGHFLWTSAWKTGRLIPKDWCLTGFMSKEHNQTLGGCYLGSSFWIETCCNCTNPTTALCFNPISFTLATICTAGIWLSFAPFIMYFDAHEDPGPVYQNYYEDKIGKYVKQCIYQKLHVSSLQMGNNADDLRLLLNLHRTYFFSDFVFTNKIDEAKLKNFSSIYQIFYDKLAETLLNSANNDAEMDNIHVGLLMADSYDKPFIIEDTPYQHCLYYGITLDHLLLDVYQRKVCINQGNLSEKVFNALQVTLPKIKAEHDRDADINAARQMGYAARAAAGL